MSANSMEGSPEVWLIAGPTASGKSALALTLAEASGGEIINADSMQLYRDLRILSARPTPAEAARAPHRLFGLADAAEAWSVGRWLRAALPAIDACREARRAAIVVGGTGLYFNALTRGLVELPAIPEGARQAAETLLARDGEAAFREALRRLDAPGEAGIGPGDRQRLVRAHAVAISTGRPLSAWRTDTRPPLPSGAWRGVVLEPLRADLYARCDARLEAMVGAGALEEVRALIARRLDPALPAMKALGVRELAAHLSGGLTLEAAVASAQRATRNYAKRQSTWFRNQTPDWPRVEQTDAKMVLAMLTVRFQDHATESAHF